MIAALLGWGAASWVVWYGTEQGGLVRYLADQEAEYRRSCELRKKDAWAAIDEYSAAIRSICGIRPTLGEVALAERRIAEAKADPTGHLLKMMAQGDEELPPPEVPKRPAPSQVAAAVGQTCGTLRAAQIDRLEAYERELYGQDSDPEWTTAESP